MDALVEEYVSFGAGDVHPQQVEEAHEESVMFVKFVPGTAGRFVVTAGQDKVRPPIHSLLPYTTHTYTYIHIHTHTYTYIHMHTHTKTTLDGPDD